MPVITNALGFLALLGIPAVLLIHFLQRRAQILPCSTLFLLQQTQRESASGRKFDKLIQSLSLWMQLLIVLLITLLLIKPRYIKKQSTQRIAIVLDSSASMSVFKEKAKNKIVEILPQLQGQASSYELWVFDSNISKDRIYHGSQTSEVQVALEKWQANSGTTDPNHALRIARSLIGKDGALVFLTDTPKTSSTYNASVVSIGKPHVNVGFTGVSFAQDRDQIIWKASLRNYSKKPTTRQWYFRTDQKTQSETTTVQLEAGELKVLQGVFPEGVNRIELILKSDAFAHDDVLPVIKPKPKQLAIQFDNHASHQLLTEKFTSSFDNIIEASSVENADILSLSTPLTEEAFHTRAAIVFLKSPKSEKGYKIGNIVTSDHALTEGLNWQKLLISHEQGFAVTASDTPLVWLDDTPIIFIREVPIGLGRSHKQLVFNFDVAQSNAAQQEATALLIYRFFESQRKEKQSLQQSITELSQPLELQVDRKGRDVITQLEDIEGNIIHEQVQKANLPPRAPESVGFYTISQGEQQLLHAANYFADTREADLSQCAEGLLEAKSAAQASDLHSEEDHYWRVWVLLALLALLLSWKSNTYSS